MHIVHGKDVPHGVEAVVDLRQRPGDVLFLSSADSELNAAAEAGRDVDAVTLRVANWSRLVHESSVDMYADKTVEGSKLVIVRLLGGRAYWRYGVERLLASGVSRVRCCPAMIAMTRSYAV